MPSTINAFEKRLNLEILQSESLRVKILAGVAAIMVVFLTILSLFVKDRILEVMDSLEPLYLIIIVLTVFCVREFNISLITKKLLKENKQAFALLEFDFSFNYTCSNSIHYYCSFNNIEP